MSAPVKQKRLPNHALLHDDESIDDREKLTREGFYNLSPKELFWQARYHYLKEHGYLLRPRYDPAWKPSWIMDATQLSDRELVAIKSFLTEGQELQIAQFFTTIRDPMNHCVPVREILLDPHDPNSALMVMPFLRPCNNPAFSTIGDVIEFVNQTLEGLVFMHKHGVAHRDVAVANIMMDAKPLYPNGHHPIRLGYTPDAMYPVSSLSRADRGVRYFYIDFGLSSQFPKGASSLVIGDVGRNARVPELSDDVPYDAFKVDIFALGDLYSKEFEQKYSNMEFLLPLIEPMTLQRPDDRPTAQQALQKWENRRADIQDSLYRWRLGPKSEPTLERVVNDTVAVAWEGVYRLKQFVK